MKRLVSAFFFVFIAINAMGQYGNEWIAYDQPYFKIPVGNKGIYRITHDDLQAAGLTGSPDPKTFQLFHRGKEQFILVNGESDGIFDASDYIEFFGRGNDGALDSTLYANPGDQPHRYYSLYSDSSSYFLTYGSVTGKRIPSYSGSSTGLAEETHHWAEKLLVMREHYSLGIDYGDVHQTVFDTGEGYTGVQILQGQHLDYVIEGITDVATASGKPVIEILLTGRGPMAHEVELSAGSRLLSFVSFSGYESHKYTQEIEWSDIDSNGKLTIKIRVPGSAGADRVSAGYIRVLFPQQIIMSGAEKSFLLNENTLEVAYLKIANPGSGLRLFDVTDPASVVLIQTELTATLDAVVPLASTQRRIFATTQVLSPDRIKIVSFREINPAFHNYVIITHPLLRKPALGYPDPVKAYAEYRALPEGGAFDTLIVNIDQLYDQFNYGEPSPRAIFQFIKFSASIKLPDYLFLVGKGLDVYYNYHRNPSAFTTYRDLVPTAGFPASDMAFSAGLSGIPDVPAVATGRLTANSPSDVAAYLNKIKERDALPFDDLNRKKILHLSGGIEEHEPALFRNIMKGFEAVAEDLYLGAQVQAIAKQSTEVKLISIADEVNQGLGLITFFGHSAPNTLDFDIGLVTDPVMGYNNAGKYPFLLMNGCDAGSFFLNTNIFGENWIKTPDKGAVGFIAHSSFGLVPALQRYTSTFYDVAFGDSAYIKKGVGKVQQEVARRYIESFGSSALSASQVQQMVLLGDPAVKLFGAEKPDYAIDVNKISISSFNGEPLTAFTDSFRIHIPVRNFGLAREGNIRIEVNREFNSRVIQYDTILPAVLYADTIAMVISNADKEGFGINVFNISVDADDLVDELSETNNEATFEYFIPLNSTRNLFPYNYSIVKETGVDLSFQYTDLHANNREYILEIDTASTFDSGFKQQFQLSAQVLGRKRVELLTTDSLVYYWRTKIAQPLENESQSWTVSSFTYINNGPEGWAQLDFPQFESNESSGLVKDPELRRIQFQETVSDLAIKTFSSASGQPVDSVSFKINGVEFNLLTEGGACRNNTINLMAFDRRSTQPYAGLYFKWYEILYEYGGRRLLCGREPYVINSFTPQELVTGNQDDLIQYVENIHEGDSVVLFNIGDAAYGQWPEAARSTLGSLGISLAQLDDLENGDPVIIFGRKGSAPGTAKIFHAPSQELFLKVDKTIAGRFTSGSMSSVSIGPAVRWDHLAVQTRELESVDHFNFAILGIQSDGTLDTLKTDITFSEDISWISADDYPHLKIIFKTGDDINLTSVQLAKWLVIFEPVAEGLIYYRGPVSQQVRFEGELLSSDFGFVNISDKTFPDSLTVEYDVLNHINPGASPSAIRIASPLPGDTTLFTVPFKTHSKGGLNDVEVFVNPRIQKEKSYDNNVIVLSDHLKVIADDAHPVMDVTFDGRYLEDNEFVSANPVILIRLWDENPFIKKADTLGIRILLASPCGSEDCEFQQIHFTSDDISWAPATETSDFTIDFTPNDLVSGTYRLRVEGSDASGNTSGEAPYEITFRVEHESSVLAAPPYPNPFFLETNFDVMITGELAIPWFYEFQLTTLSGTLVTEFSDHTTGLHVGKNRLKWDGFGKEGKSLPNGIYLYRLLIRGGDQQHEYRGKVVLLR
ncbi:MAG: C25 family cysteine peptidase [Cyclobacteriaceae bacterium]